MDYYTNNFANICNKAQHIHMLFAGRQNDFKVQYAIKPKNLNLQHSISKCRGKEAFENPSEYDKNTLFPHSFGR